MIAALWSNSNYDDDKGTRKEAIADIEENYDEAVRIIFSGKKPEDDEEDISDNPFFDATVRGMAKIEAPRHEDGTVQSAIASGKLDAKIDQ